MEEAERKALGRNLLKNLVEEGLVQTRGTLRYHGSGSIMCGGVGNLRREHLDCKMNWSQVRKT